MRRISSETVSANGKSESGYYVHPNEGIELTVLRARLGQMAIELDL